MDIERIIKDYYQAWIESDREKARSYVADDLKFVSPNDHFESADEFLDVCWTFSKGFDKMDIHHEVYSEDSAYLVYSGNGFCCGELLKIRDGKISEVYVTFDPTR